MKRLWSLGKLTLVAWLCFVSLLFAQEIQAPCCSEKGMDAVDLFNQSNQLLDKFGTPIPIADDQTTLTFSGQFRYRLELRDNFNFNRKFEDDAISLLRSRLGAQLDIGSWLEIFAQGQDSESFASQTANKSSSFVNRIDLHQLYAMLKSPWEQVPIYVKVGRQELSYGDQRFVGTFDWSNVARVFDAVKLIYKPTKQLQWDTWYSQVVPVNHGQADSADHSNHFWGTYLTTQPITDHILDAFLLVRHDENNELKGEYTFQRGQLKEYTVGNRIKGKKMNFDYGLEWAYQFGSRAHNLIQAWAWHHEAGYTFASCPWAPRIGFEYNHGSGDGKADDGRFGTFDNLFPTNHLYYGYIDFASLRNIDHFKIGFTIEPHERVKVAADYHFFFLDTNKSAWFNAAQGVIRNPSPNASGDVGREFDLTAWWKISKHFKFLIGYAYFLAGPFVDDTGTSANANFFYVQPTVEF